MCSYIVTLGRWDDVAWHEEDSYSARAVPVIKAGYRALAESPRQLAAFLKTYNTLAELIQAPLGAHQRERVCYLLGSAQAADRNYDAALRYLDEALALAEELDEQGDCVEILIVHASVKRALGLLTQAAADLNSCLAIWSDHAREHGTDVTDCVDADQYLQVLTTLAGYEYFQMHFARARELIAQARSVLPLHGSHEHVAMLDWNEALLARTQHLQAEAYAHAQHALRYFKHAGNPLSLVRLYSLVAQTAMDYAETIAEGRRRDALVRNGAIKRLKAGMEVAYQADDRNGICLLTLALARAERLLRQTTDRVAEIESIIASAREIEDVALLTSAYTALGDEYAAQERHAEALQSYRHAIHANDGFEIPALKLPALLMIKKLEIAEPMSV